MANQLQHQDSPYLQQHKDNPVHWYPWCDEAFQRAKAEHKAIFISIGYSSCHWCHVMEHEVFEQETIAAYLNEHFISIKVDREERPDIDKHYQNVHMLLNRRPGGWPTSIFCTPDNKPFFAGTYLPPASRDNLVGFSELTQIIAEKIAKKDEDLFKNADDIQNYLGLEDRPKEATIINDSLMKTFIKQATDAYEPTYGGFSVAPKFPHTATLNTLMTLQQLHPSDHIDAIITHTLSSMQAGGMYDLVDGGFCRYSVDTQWLVPHFEKMTYDNGLLCELYTRAYSITQEVSYLRTAKEIANFMNTFMIASNLYYSASDADSEGNEGTYFVYTYQEVFDGLKASGCDNTLAKRRAMRLSVSKEGNFEGRNIIRFSSMERESWFDEIKPYLADIRKPRPYPFIDRKVQTSWNAMMIKGLFALGAYDSSYTDQGVASLNALLDKMQDGETLMHSTLLDKAPKITAFLEDYAYLGTTLIAAYEATYEERYLILAQQQANTALQTYYDEGRWFFSTGEFVTEAEASDGSYPGSVGVIVDLLLSLGSLVEEKYRHFAFKTIEYYSAKLAKTPIHFPYLVNQALRYIKEDRIIKASPQTLKNLPSVTYPFTLTKAEDNDAILLCGRHSCFATTLDPCEVNSLIANSL